MIGKRVSVWTYGGVELFGIVVAVAPGECWIRIKAPWPSWWRFTQLSGIEE